MRLVVVISKDVAKTFGIELDNQNKPQREGAPCGKIKLKKPKVPPHIQKKFVKFINSIECEGKIRPSELKEIGFDVGRLEPSPYTGWAIKIAQNLIFKVYGLKVKSEDIRLLKIKLSRDYRVTIGLVYKRAGIATIFVLVVDGGKREDYYQ